jgi:hypothetical protein
MSENQNQENNNQQARQQKRSDNRDRRVRAIQSTAFNTKLPNGVQRELTYNQALSILIRSRQLYNESREGMLSDSELRSQINACYAQRARELFD